MTPSALNSTRLNTYQTPATSAPKTARADRDGDKDNSKVQEAQAAKAHAARVPNPTATLGNHVNVRA
jgi:hypothetical protein